MSTQVISIRQRSAAPVGRPIGWNACGDHRPMPFLSAPDRFHGRQQIYQLVRCPSCELVWLEDPPPPEQVGEHYGPDYDRSVAAAGDSPERWTRRVRTIAQYKNGGSLLDLGCSSGGFLQSMAGPSWKLDGIEMSESVARSAGAASGAQVFAGDILDASFAPASFDVVTCFHVFEHLYEPQAVLQKVAEWLKPGGIFYVNVPNIDSAGARIFRSYWYALELPRHLFHFSPVSLGSVARAAGLETVSLTTERELFFEKSVRYCFDSLFRRAGRPRVPLAKSADPGLLFRAVRKLFRLTALPAINGIGALAGDGESIHGIFRKPAP
jgi:2-polyprenyl-3-methyl-5-hydroxy-6-metoxy-1,4-benzoquinol methylase